MPGEDLQSRIAAAQVYENLFVPAEFKEWAPRMIAAARIAPGQRVLDVACGTGVLAREAAARVGRGGFVAGVDIDAGMLTVAARTSADIEFRQAGADALPFGDASFDAVVSQFGLMFFPDRTRALRDMVRVLKSHGRLAVAVWDTLENTPAYATLVALLDRVAGSRAGAALRAPFSLGDRRELTTLVETAGLAAFSVDTVRGAARFPAVRQMVEAELRGWLPVAGIVLTEDQIARLFEDAEIALASYRTSDGSVRFDSPAHIVSGVKA